MRNPHPSTFTHLFLKTIKHYSSFIIHHSLFIIHCSLFILLALALISCNSTTKPPTASLTGRVVLVNDTDNPALDPADFSGISVALYPLAVLDTTIVRLNQEYPQIGVIINQETEFNHRLLNPVKVLTTAADGNFSFSGITPGSYNLAILKTGWGYIYVPNLNLAEGGNTLPVGRSDVSLYPERQLPAAIETDYSFLSGRTYRVADDSVIMGNVTIHTGTSILIESGNRLDLYGNVSSSGSSGYWKVSTAEEMYTTTKADSLPRFDSFGIKSLQGLPQISRMICEYANNGVATNNQPISFSNSIIRNANASALNLTSEAAEIQRLLVYNNPYKGITAYVKAHIEKSLFVNNHESCMLHQAKATVEDSYFYGSYLGIRSFLNPQEIRHNSFDKNDVAIAPSASSPAIEYNDFYDNQRDIELNRGGVATDPGYCNPYIQRNNFYGNKFYIHLRGVNSVYADGYIPFTGVNTNQHYPNNYWKSSNLVDHIFDSNYPGSGVAYTVNYTPRSAVPVQGTGIRG